MQIGNLETVACSHYEGEALVLELAASRGRWVSDGSEALETAPKMFYRVWMHTDDNHYVTDYKQLRRATSSIKPILLR